MLAFKYVAATFLLGASLVGCVTIAEEPTEETEQLSVAPPPKEPIIPPGIPPILPPSYPKHPSIPPSDPNRPPIEQCLSCHPNGFPGPPKPYDPHWPNYPNKRGKKLPPGQDPGDPMCLSCHTEPPDPIVATDEEQLPSLDP